MNMSTATALDHFGTVFATYERQAMASERGFTATWDENSERDLAVAGWKEGDESDASKQLERNVRAQAATDMAYNLSEFTVRAKEVLASYTAGNITEGEATEQTNGILGEMTGLRYVLECLHATLLTDDVYDALDANVARQQASIADALIAGIASKSGTVVTFDIHNGGLTV
jgi:predicted nucleic acid-binding protein